MVGLLIHATLGSLGGVGPASAEAARVGRVGGVEGLGALSADLGGGAVVDRRRCVKADTLVAMFVVVTSPRSSRRQPAAGGRR
jgi:hypothetical protein